MIKALTDNEIRLCEISREFRVGLARFSFWHYCLVYESHNFELDPAFFHLDIVEALESKDFFIAIEGFRGSGKTSLVEAYARWVLITAKHQLSVYLAATDNDAKMKLANIRSEIEENELLRADFGINIQDRRPDFREKWSEGQITINGCTMIPRSRMQRVRGIKYRKGRIGCIIGDDIETGEDVQTVEQRKKTRRWFFTEVLPATANGKLANDIKVILIGNRVHKDCLLAHIGKSNIVKVLKFAIVDENGRPTWPALYPDQATIDREYEKVMIAGEGLGRIIWAREYLLKDVDEEDAVITPDKFKFYPKTMLALPRKAAGVGVDLAISKKAKADYTAMVPAVDIKTEDSTYKLCILSGFAGKVGFKEMLEKAEALEATLPAGTVWYVEKVAYQEAACEVLESGGFSIERTTPFSDKRSRVVAACHYIESGRVLFPDDGSAQAIIDNLVGFGIDEHDDIADAAAIVILAMAKNKSFIFG